MFRYILICVLLVPFVVSAMPKGIGYIMEFEGKVQIVRKLGVRTPKKKRVKIVKIDGQKRQQFQVLKYEKLYAEDELHTGKGAKAKIIMKNKNVVFVNEYGKLNFPKTVSKRKKGDNLFGMVYGKVRGVVVKSKKEKVKVSSPTAVMGIRGTDFMVEHSPYKGKTEVSVLRGEIELKKKEVPKAKKVVEKAVEKAAKAPAPKPEPVVIKAGYSGAVKEKVAPEVAEEVVKEAPVKEAVVEAPKKIPLEKLDTAEAIAMVKTKPEDSKVKDVELKELEKEAVQANKQVEKKITEDILKKRAGEEKISAKELKKKGKIDLNASLKKLMDKRLDEKGIDKKAYKKVPVVARLQARKAGMEDKELTMEKIKERSKTNPEIKKVFDSVKDYF